MECPPLILGLVLGLGWIDGHAANRIFYLVGYRHGVMMVCVMLMIVHGVLHESLALSSGCLPRSLSYPIYPQRVWYQGYSFMHDAARQKVTQRLKRIEGQVGGLLRMVDDNRYCIDMLTQISAVRAALHKVEEEILRDHLSHCVADAFSSGSVTDQRHKVEELVQTLGRMTR